MIVYILFVIGFVLLIKGADFLVDGASSLARRLGVSDLVVGLTIVAFGTSAPELFVSVFSSIAGTTDIAVGNILGSNIINILVILGVAAIIYPLAVTKGTVWKEIPFSLLAAVLIALMANAALVDKGAFHGLTRFDGVILLVFFIIFIYYVFSIIKHPGFTETVPASARYGMVKTVIFILVGLGFLFLGAQWVVNGAVQLARALGASESLVSLTIVAGGTSLPELATSVAAAFKKNADIAVGNIIGSNIFNIFLILGTSAVIRPLPFTNKNNVDIAIAVLASFMLFIAMFTGKKKNLLDKWEGIVFVVIYTAYITFLIIQG